jgi:hypothetical protein
MKILVIGDTSEQLSTWTQLNFGKGTLVNSCNLNTALSTSGIYYTGLGDLLFDEISKLSLVCDKIVLCPNLPWKDTVARSKTMILCNYLSNFCEIQNWSQKTEHKFLTKSVSRQYVTPTLWTFGCSHTVGVGLNNPNHECYGKLLADQLCMPWQNISQGASSTAWSLNHLIHADIHTNDIVVWATTSAERYQRADTLDHVVEEQLRNPTKNIFEHFTDDQILFNHINLINHGVKFLRKSNIKFIILLLQAPHQYYDTVEFHCSHFKEWCPTMTWNDHDRAADGVHVGPLGHQVLAKYLYDHIQLLKYV